MSDAALHRTARRGVALVSLLLSSIALGLEQFVWSDFYGASPDSAFGFVVYVAVPTLVFAGALCYLLASAVRAAAARLEPDATDREA
jgi:hypothetical protein